MDGVLFSKDKKKLLVYPSGKPDKCYSVPEGTNSVIGGSVQGTKLELLRLPKSVEKLAKGATDVPYVAFWHAGIAGSVGYPICLGGSIEELPPKLKNNAIKGFLYAIRHGIREIEAYKTDYLDYIKRNEKTYMKQAMHDEGLLRLMIEENLLSEKGMQTLLKETEMCAETDLIAVLLDYQQKHFGKKPKKETPSLSDDDPEMQRMLKMAARREAIKDQKGIRGIVFVQTGNMNNFGYYDEYIGAKDMSDLKAYIEARGGYLRSTVSSNTDYLICNDLNSDTVKSKKAKELGVPVITEAAFLKMAEEKV